MILDILLWSAWALNLVFSLMMLKGVVDRYGSYRKKGATEYLACLVVVGLVALPVCTHLYLLLNR